MFQHKSIQIVGMLTAVSMLSTSALAGGKRGGNSSRSSSSSSSSSSSYSKPSKSNSSSSGSAYSRPSLPPSYSRPSSTPARSTSTPARSTPQPSTYNRPGTSTPAYHPSTPASRPATQATRPSTPTPTNANRTNTSRPTGPTGPSSTNNGSTRARGNTAATPRAPQTYNPASKYPTTKTANGGVIENRGNHQVHYRADGSREKVVAGNKTTVYRADGSRAQVTRGSTRIDYGQGGSQSVYRGGVRQYNQNRVVINNTTVIQRTYYRGGSSYVRTYNPYSWGGRPYYAYTPSVIFAPSFYGYMYTPWYAPVSYSWGWNSSPWYNHYGYYYHPYVHYTSPAYWLTDYLISDMLSNQYQDSYGSAQVAQANAQAAQANERTAEANERTAEANERAAQAQHAAAPITDEVKEQIKAQVEEAIKANEQKNPIQIGTLMTDTNHVYAVSDDLDVTTAENGSECTLTSGDLIRLAQSPNDGDQAASMLVISAKKESCAAGSKIMVSMTDLQSFQNDFAERVETGMGKMKTEMKK